MSDSTNVGTPILRTAGTATRHFAPVYPPPSSVWIVSLPPGVTDSSPWESARNPCAGVRELLWFEAHKEELAAFQGMWIAVLGERIVASRRSPHEIRTELDGQGIRDALVVRVPDDVTQREYFIG